MANQINWLQELIDLIQAIISGVFVGWAVFWLDERRAKRDRQLSDFRIATNWSKNEPKISLKNFDLSNANLSGHNFVEANLEDTKFTNSKMWATNFSEANLRQADFRGTQLVGVKFIKATAIRADFSRAVIKSRKDPDYVYSPDFSDSILPYAKFLNSSVEGCIFKNANLKGVDFSKAQFFNCDFSDADLTNSKWKKVNKVENCTWKNVKADNPENSLYFCGKKFNGRMLYPKREGRMQTKLYYLVKNDTSRESLSQTQEELDALLSSVLDRAFKGEL